MIRDIKFRGKSIDDGDWVYGYVFQDHFDAAWIQVKVGPPDSLGIYSIQRVKVIPETVGQYTGKNGRESNEIYEDDWCEAQFRDSDGIHVVQGRIIFDEGMWCLDCTGTEVCPDIYSINRLHSLYIIGNIHDNPELLK